MTGISVLCDSYIKLCKNDYVNVEPTGSRAGKRMRRVLTTDLHYLAKYGLLKNGVCIGALWKGIGIGSLEPWKRERKNEESEGHGNIH